MSNTLEYQTYSHDGVIEIPQKYQDDWNGKKVRVVLMETEDEDPVPESSLMSRLREIRVCGPADFSENHDSYLNGAKDV